MTAPVVIRPAHPHTVDDIARMAKVVAASGLFGVKTIEQAAALMFVAQADGLHPATIARDYDILDGRPAKRAEAMLRDFIRNGGSVTWHLLSDEAAEATFSHPQGGEVRISWDMERAWAADLGASDMWRRFPRQMLRSRVLSEGIRTVCPLATGGMYVPEEVRDFAPGPVEPRPLIHVPAAPQDAREEPQVQTAEAEFSPKVAAAVSAATVGIDMCGNEKVLEAWLKEHEPSLDKLKAKSAEAYEHVLKSAEMRRELFRAQAGEFGDLDAVAQILTGKAARCSPRPNRTFAPSSAPTIRPRTLSWPSRP
jgi:hypothetical protein